MNNSKESNFASAIIYVHDSQQHVSQTLETLYNQFNDNFLYFELICVDDASTDNSINLIKEFLNEHSGCSISLVTMGYFHGIEPSMEAGVDLAIGDFVFEFDSTLVDYHEDLIMDVYRKALTGIDIVSARPQNGISPISKQFYTIYNKFSDSTYGLATERFRVISRRAINRVDSISIYTPYRKAIYASCGLKIGHVDYDNKIYNDINLTNQSKSSRKRVAFDTLVIFTNLAYKITFGLALFMATLMFGTGIYTIVIYFGQHRPIEGWSPLMGVIAAGFFGIFTIFTIIIKYLDIILKMIFKKQKYLISNIKKM